MILALVQAVFTCVYYVVSAAVAFLYAQNSDVSINWLLIATIVLTGITFSIYISWDSAQKQRLASTRKHVQQHIEDCQWILFFDDKIRYPIIQTENTAGTRDLIAYMEFVEKQDLVHDQALKANILPFVTAVHQSPKSAIVWNADYEYKAGQLHQWLQTIGTIVQGTHEYVNILTAEEDKRLLLRLKIAYYNLWEVLGQFFQLTVATTNQTNANWNELQKHMNNTLDERNELHKKKTSQTRKTNTNVTKSRRLDISDKK